MDGTKGVIALRSVRVGRLCGFGIWGFVQQGSVLSVRFRLVVVRDRSRCKCFALERCGAILQLSDARVWSFYPQRRCRKRLRRGSRSF